jgi:predicted RNA-binding protein with TRAM domain
MRKLMLLVVLVLSSFSLAACSFGEVNITKERGSDTFHVTVALNEDDFAGMIAESQRADHNRFLQDPVVDLQDGQIKVSGVHEKRDGSGTVDGYMILVPSVQDGRLLLQAVEVNIDGMNASDEQIARFNENLAERLMHRQDNRRGDLEVTAVSVTNDLFTLTFDITPDR